MNAIGSKVFKNIKQLKKMSKEEIKPKSVKRGAVPLLDENGFKIRKVQHEGKNDQDEDTEYIIDGKFRRTKPYYFTYTTYCKLRWRGKTLAEVFSTEFRLYSESYYMNALNSGSVTLNGEKAGKDTVLKNGDYIRHRIHRHEPPVSSKDIKIVYQDDKIVVIDKPSGIPVHPTGRYRHNTVTFILKKEHNLAVHPCNRLDRLTSGLMFLGKNPKAAEAMASQIKNRLVSKQYLAKVVGEFPLGEIVVDKPIYTYDPRVSMNVVDEKNGKEAKTIFKRLSYDGEHSVVLCKPFTGRTHQIRVHLQYIGHPIINDPIYSSPSIWGKNLGKNGEFDKDEVFQKLESVGKTVKSSSYLHCSKPNTGEVLTGEKCEICNQELYTDPDPSDLELYLHAYKYESTNEENPWSYQTELPDWVREETCKYMDMAIEEAKKSEPTPTAFCVGAVLVNSGKILSTGFSRELPGNTHAEQCALEKFGEDVPEGTELYTTMEPCSLRLSGNEPCLDRIIKQKGKICTVFVGVMEPSTFVKNNVSFDKLSSSNINYILIDGYAEQAEEIAARGH